jgi:hypothetical protein
LIENKRMVVVDSGTVIVAANSARDLMNSVVKNTGLITASSMVQNGGNIQLVAGTVTNTGQLQADGKGANSKGGQITVAGDHVVLAANSQTTATGEVGGGLILVGTKPADVTNSEPVILAKTVTIEENAKVDASAITTGNGGTIVIASKDSTAVNGLVSAHGGAKSGNGGQIQTQSQTTVAIGSSVKVDVSAPAGAPGTWAVTAGNLTIDTSGCFNRINLVCIK